MDSDTWAALRDLYVGDKKPLTEAQHQKMRQVFKAYPLGQTDYNIWLNQTLRASLFNSITSDAQPAAR